MGNSSATSHPPRKRGKKISTLNLIFRILLVLYLGTVAYLCFGHFDNLPSVKNSFLGIPTDKLVHFCMFFPFPVIFFLAYDNLTKKPWQSAAFAVGTFLLGCLIAAGTEIGQGLLTTYRSQDPKDFMADTLALAIAAVTVLIIDLRKQFTSLPPDGRPTASDEEGKKD